MSPASYRAAPPRVGSVSLKGREVIAKSLYLRPSAAIAAASAAFKRSCARPYAAKSPFASAAFPSASACLAFCYADFRSAVALLVVVVTGVPEDDVPEFPPNT